MIPHGCGANWGLRMDPGRHIFLWKFLLDIMHLKCIISTNETAHEPNLYQKIVGAGHQKGCHGVSSGGSDWAAPVR
jgi:hypothetical protein